MQVQKKAAPGPAAPLKAARVMPFRCGLSELQELRSCWVLYPFSPGTSWACVTGRLVMVLGPTFATPRLWGGLLCGRALFKVPEERWLRNDRRSRPKAPSTWRSKEVLERESCTLEAISTLPSNE